LGGLFTIQWIVPQLTLLEEFLHSWEPTKDGHIKAIICGEKITNDQVLIIYQFGISAKGVVDVANTLVKEAQVAFKNIARPNAFVNKKQWSMIRIMEEYHTKFATIM
jgi:hypothetical protein